MAFINTVLHGKITHTTNTFSLLGEKSCYTLASPWPLPEGKFSMLIPTTKSVGFVVLKAPAVIPKRVTLITGQLKTVML